MAIDLICPECGGVVGATEVTDAGRPCTCFAPKPRPGDPAAARDQTEHYNRSADFEPTEKVCCLCGKDVSEAKRYRDERGYWCVDCHKRDRKRQRNQTLCPECGRSIPKDAVVDYSGMPMCRRCRRERVDAENEKRFKPVPQGAYIRQEQRTMIVLLSIMAVLILILILVRSGIL